MPRFPQPACGRTVEHCTCAGSKGLARIAHAKHERMAFLTKEDLPIIAADPVTRLTPVLVRCGGCRFSAPAQDVRHLIDIIERDRKATANDRDQWAGDYVRDISILSNGDHSL
jgi:hypothetical protein